MTVDVEEVLLVSEPVPTLSRYRQLGGGDGIAAALDHGREWAIRTVADAGLRGRGGAGFPTARKWSTVHDADAEQTYVVANAAEGEPATFKDRYLMRRNPFAILEGLAIAAYAVGASRAFVVTKLRFEQEIAGLVAARDAMAEAGMLAGVDVQLVPGPDEYLLGEEKAMLEAIESSTPVPRIFPPYLFGPFARRARNNPTVMNNVETLAHVPAILRRGPEWFRAHGTESSPGTMIFTVCGDLTRPGVHELPLGIPLRLLTDLVCGGAAAGRHVKIVVPGASAGVLTEAQLDVPLDFDTLRAAGSSLGSGGFAVYDDSACAVGVALTFARFLSIESCAQCPACKQGTQSMVDSLERIESGTGTERDLKTIQAKCSTVTGGQRCALPTGASTLVSSMVDKFADEFAAHLGRACPMPRELPVPKIVDFDEPGGRFHYDERYRYKQPDWTYSDEQATGRGRSA